MRRTSVLVALALVAGLAGTGAARAVNDPHCTDTSRACVIAAATSYLDAVRTHSGEHVLLAPRVKRTRNAGEQTPETQWYTEAEMRASLDHDEDSVLDVRDPSFYVDGDQVVVYYLIEASYAEGGQQAAQTWLFERFHVTGGLIDEMEAIFFFAPGVTPTDRGWPSPTPADPAARGAVLAAAQTYLDAQVSRDYSAARLSGDVRRTLNGQVTAVNRETAQAVELPAGATAYQARDVRWFVDESTGDAVAFVAFDQGLPGGAHVATLHTVERLHVAGGLVNQIEQIAWPTPGSAPTPTGWES